MAVIRKTLNFSAQTPQSPWVNIPSGWSKVAGSDNSRIVNRPPVVWEQESGTTALVRDDTILTGQYRCAEVKLSSLASMPSLAGAALLNSASSGIAVLTSSTANNYRIFEVVSGQLNTTVLWTSSGAVFAPNGVIRIIYDDIDKKYRVYFNGVQVFASGSVEYTNNTYSPSYAAAISRFGSLVELTSEYEPAQTLTAGTNPVIPGESSSWTCSGFTNGSAVLSFGGELIPVTIASNAFTVTIPMVADNVEWPKLPASGVEFELTQGELSAVTSVNISLPNGYDTLRDENGNPSTFLNIKMGDDKSLGQAFADAGNPLLETNSMIWPGLGEVVFNLDGTGSALSARNIIFFVHRDDGKYYAHGATITEDGIDPGSVTFLTGVRVIGSRIIGYNLTGRIL